MTSETLKSFVKNYFFSFSSKVFLAVVGLLFTYIIANYLGPSDYGLIVFYMAFAVSIASLFGMEIFSDLFFVFTAKFKSKKFFLEALKWEYFLIVLVFLVSFFFADFIVSFIGKSNVLFFRIATVLILLTPLQEAFKRLFFGFKCFGKVLKGLVLENTLNLSFAFLFVVVLGFGVWGVIYAKFIAIFAFIFLSFFYFRALDFKKGFFDVKSVKKYTKGLIPSRIFNRLRQQSELIFMGLFVANWQLGFFYLASKIVTYLLDAPKDALSKVLLPYNVEKRNDLKTMGRFASLSIKFSFLFTFTVGAFILILAGPVLKMFFPDFSNSFYLFPFFIILYLVKEDAPLATIFKALNRTDILAFTEFCSLVMGIAAGFFLISSMQAVGIIFARVLVFLTRFLVMFYFLRMLKIRVEVIPRFKDLKFFYSSLKLLLPFWH